MDDSLIKYTSDEGIDLPQLIHDDFFLAIKLTFIAGLHVSAAKMLVSCIDSVAYIGGVSPPIFSWNPSWRTKVRVVGSQSTS